jgi:DNA-binding beta-propeller fold protein YncE
MVTSDNGVLVYSFDTGSVSAIQLLNSITGASVSPVAADITPDGTLLYVAASDGTLHQISTILATDVTPQIGFPPIPNANNGFCVNGFSLVSCTLNLVVARP